MTAAENAKRVPMPTPWIPASAIPYRCWCGFRGMLDQADAHRAEHKRNDRRPK